MVTDGWKTAKLEKSDPGAEGLRWQARTLVRTQRIKKEKDWFCSVTLKCSASDPRWQVDTFRRKIPVEAETDLFSCLSPEHSVRFLRTNGQIRVYQRKERKRQDRSGASVALYWHRKNRFFKIKVIINHCNLTDLMSVKSNQSGQEGFFSGRLELFSHSD